MNKEPYEMNLSVILKCLQVGIPVDLIYSSGHRTTITTGEDGCIGVLVRYNGEECVNIEDIPYNTLVRTAKLMTEEDRFDLSTQLALTKGV